MMKELEWKDIILITYVMNAITEGNIDINNSKVLKLF